MAEEKGHHTEAHESEGHNPKEMGVCDSWYCKIMDWVTTQVADFVAFLFIVFSLLPIVYCLLHSTYEFHFQQWHRKISNTL